LTTKNERRRHTRQVLGGNAEITSVVGQGAAPSERATIINCSRGGALLRIPSPRRKMFKKQAPCINISDSLTCVLRVPPVYQDIEVFAEVVHVQRTEGDPDHLYAGLRFFYDVQRRSGLDRHMKTLRRLLGDHSEIVPPEPVKTPPKQSARLKAKTSARVQSSKSGRQSGKTARLGKVSSRQGKVTGGRSSERRKLAGDNGVTGHAKISQPQKVWKPTKSENDPLGLLDESSTTRALRWLDEARAALPTFDESNRVRPLPSKVSITPPNGTRRPEVVPAPRRQEPIVVPPALSARQSSSSNPRLSSGPSGVPPIYFNLSGPEVGIYARGCGRLQRGEVTVELPDHFAQLADPKTITVHLTPCGECFGLFVTAKSAEAVHIKELGGGTSSAAFDYMIVARRRG